MVGLSLGVASASPNEQIRLAIIGVRNQGKDLAASFARFADAHVATLCDVDESLFAPAARVVEEAQGRPPQFERDFRRVLDDPTVDAVVIATPDHWHALMTILACQAGKDVYVEKPVSHTIREGERMLAAAAHHRRVVQTGLQQRSGEQFRSAVEFVRSGQLGTVRLAKAWTVHRRKPIGFRTETAPPKDVDYDLWLGPAPSHGFTANRFHYNWRWFWDYGSGELGNWGVHMLDIARWGLGVELPARVSATGGTYHFDDDQETPDTLHVQYTFDGSTAEPLPKTILWEHRLWTAHAPEGRSAAAAFYGDRGTLIVDRGGWKVYDTTENLTAGGSDSASRHHRNFLDAIRTRQQPNADLTTGHVSTTLGHLGNIAHRLGREVLFDSHAMTFGADLAANALLSREPRPGWELPVV